MNIRNTTAKERMLKKIRQALLQKRESPHIDFEDSPLYKDEEESLDVTFAREVTRVGGNFVYCDGASSLTEHSRVLAEKLPIKRILARDPHIQALLGQYGFPTYTTDQQREVADAGITGCEALLARDGSVLLSNSAPAGRR